MYSFEHLNFVGNLKTRNGLFLRTKTHKNAKPGGGGENFNTSRKVIQESRSKRRSKKETSEKVLSDSSQQDLGFPCI